MTGGRTSPRSTRRYASRARRRASRCGGISFTEIGLRISIRSRSTTPASSRARLTRGLQISHQGLCLLLPSPSGATTITRTRAPGHRPERRRVSPLSTAGRRDRLEHSLGAPPRGRRGLRISPPPRGRQPPEDAGRRGGCDASATSVASSTTSFTRDASALQHLRDQLGLRLEGKVNGCPTLDQHGPGAHPKGEVYINFQDPKASRRRSRSSSAVTPGRRSAGTRTTRRRGYGWAGPFIGQPEIMKYQYVSDAPVDELQKSIIFDDYGRTDTFNYDIESGSTTSRCRSAGRADVPKNRIVVEGNSSSTTSRPTCHAVRREDDHGRRDRRQRHPRGRTEGRVHDAQLDEHRPGSSAVVAPGHASCGRSGGRECSQPVDGAGRRRASCFHVAVAASPRSHGCSFRPAASAVAALPEWGLGTTDVRRATALTRVSPPARPKAAFETTAARSDDPDFSDFSACTRAAVYSGFVTHTSAEGTAAFVVAEPSRSRSRRRPRPLRTARRTRAANVIYASTKHDPPFRMCRSPRARALGAGPGPAAEDATDRLPHQIATGYPGTAATELIRSRTARCRMPGSRCPSSAWRAFHPAHRRHRSGVERRSAHQRERRARRREHDAHSPAPRCSFAVPSLRRRHGPLRPRARRAQAPAQWMTAEFDKACTTPLRASLPPRSRGASPSSRTWRSRTGPRELLQLARTPIGADIRMHFIRPHMSATCAAASPHSSRFSLLRRWRRERQPRAWSLATRRRSRKRAGAPRGRDQQRSRHGAHVDLRYLAPGASRTER